MQFIITPLLCIFCFVSVSAQESLIGKIVGLHDGDSVTLLVDRTQQKIRLVGIDAPEIGQDFGNKSKQALAGKIHGKTVTVKTKGQDRYGRTLGTIYVGNTNINWWMVENGWAWQYSKYNQSPELKSLQIKAQNKKLGIWSASAIPPWQYRANKKAIQKIKKAREENKNVILTYWLNTSSNVRHNSKCHQYKKTKRGRVCQPEEGKSCGQCGG